MSMGKKKNKNVSFERYFSCFLGHDSSRWKLLGNFFKIFFFTSSYGAKLLSIPSRFRHAFSKFPFFKSFKKFLWGFFKIGCLYNILIWKVRKQLKAFWSIDGYLVFINSSNCLKTFWYYTQKHGMLVGFIYVILKCSLSSLESITINFVFQLRLKQSPILRLDNNK